VISALFILIAAICKAVADTLIHHYDTSIFRFSNRRFWDPSISYKFVKYLPLTKYRADGWHLANSIGIVSWSLAVVLHEALWPWWVELLLAGAIFNLVFNLFYNKILR
jgi:hypothetical protein